METDLQLFEENKEAELSALQEQIDKVQSDRVKFLETHKPFNETVFTIKFENKDSRKRISFKVPTEMALKFTQEHYSIAENYRVVLNPLSHSEALKTK